jgi:membrane-bound lytic murein transglycosylase B
MPRFLARSVWLPPSQRVVAALLLGVSAALASDVAQPDIPTYRDRPEVRAFIQSLVAKHQFDAQALTRLLGGVRIHTEAVALVAPPQIPVRRSWRVYRSRFVEPLRIRAGVTFWREHVATLARAEKEFGVPAEILVGILGVETIYGRNMGRFPVLDALTTLAFDYPEAPNKPGRSAMFLRELEDYLVWCRDTQQDATLLTGSYTGAIGIPQFLPSSIRTYALDYDGDGRIDLRGSPVDAIGSVAHYLKEQGWEPRRPILWRVARTKRAQTAAAAKADGDPDLKWRMGDLLDAGVLPQSLGGTQRIRAFRKAERETKVVIVDLPTPDRPTEYQIGLNNFYVITRYNRSFFYAMSVVDLGRAVKQAMMRKRP